MKKHARTVIKGILLTLVFVLTFNLSLSQVDYGDFKSPITIALAEDETMEFTEEEAEQSLEDDLMDSDSSGDPVPTTAEILAEQFPQEAFDTNSALRDVAKWATVLHRIFHPMINFFSFQIGNFLGIDYIYEGAMGDMLKLIWTVSRNIVNIIFVLILLGLALREIFDIRGGAEGGKLKNYLIKFTLLLVAVNFSWLATKVILDASNVATNIVFSIPMGVARTDLTIDYEPCVVVNDKETEGQCYPTAFYYPYGSDPGSYEYRLGEGASGPEIQNPYATAAVACNKDDIKTGYDEAYFLVEGVEDTTEDSIGEDRTNEYWGKSITCWGNMNLLKYNRNSSVVYLTYGMARIQNLIKSSGGTLAQISVGTIMSLLLQGAYTVTLLALFIALIIRMAILWIFVAFSPFLVLMLFSEKFKIAGDKVGISQFIKWAFVPVKVGAIFTVVFLMISAGQSAGYITGKTWEAMNGAGTVTNNVIGFSSLMPGMDSMTQFIWLLIVLGILWVGVFSVLGDMPIVGKITGVIDSLGKRAGTWMAKTPYWAPIVPMYDHKTKEWRTTSVKGEFRGGMDNYAAWEAGVGSEESSAALNSMIKAANDMSSNTNKRKAILNSIRSEERSGGKKFLVEFKLSDDNARKFLKGGQLKTYVNRAGFTGEDESKVMGAVRIYLGEGGGVVPPKAPPTATPTEPPVTGGGASPAE